MNSKQTNVHFNLNNKILTADETRMTDSAFVETLGVPSICLMENAATESLRIIFSEYSRDLKDSEILIFCGKGNNGGDGLALARHFYEYFHELKLKKIRVFVLSLSESDYSQDAKINFIALTELIKNINKKEICLELAENFVQNNNFSEKLFVIDALLGTGLKENLKEPVRSIVQKINALSDKNNKNKIPVIALDMPTGINSDTGQVMGEAIKASMTITMACLKPGLLLNKNFSGEIKVAHIGIPDFIVKNSTENSKTKIFLTDKETIRENFPRKRAGENKYSAGTVTVIGGSENYAGAVCLASEACMRIGTGIIFCAYPEIIKASVTARMPELVSLPFEENFILERAYKSDCILIGNGLGKEPKIYELARNIIKNLAINSNKPVVIDADGLNALASDSSFINKIFKKYSRTRFLLTPHEGEFLRLTGLSKLTLESNKINILSDFAAKWNSVILLKGIPCLIAFPTGEVFINPTGETSAAATAGTGDVLAGLCAGLIAQGLSPENSAITGIYLAGLCADSYTEKFHESSMIASDILKELPSVLTYNSTSF